MPRGVYIRTDNHRKNISKSKLGINNYWYGRKHTEETKKKMRENHGGNVFKKGHTINRGRIRTEETKRKISISMKGNKHMLGLHPSEITRLKMSKSHSGDKNPMYGKKGELSPSWKGGLSFEPYGLEWSKTLKDIIRRRDDFRCCLCKVEQNGRKHSIHHIDYDKKNNNIDNLITLCLNCHMLTNFNREYWIIKFSNMVG